MFFFNNCNSCCCKRENSCVRCRAEQPWCGCQQHNACNCGCNKCQKAHDCCRHDCCKRERPIFQCCCKLQNNDGHYGCNHCGYRDGMNNVGGYDND